MKILILTNYANGLWLFRKELLMAFMEDGHDVAVSLPPDSYVDRLRTLKYKNKALRIIETPFERRGNNPLKDFRLFLAYKSIIKRVRPDVVLTYTIKPNLYGGLACRLAKVPYICNITGLGTAIEDGGALSKALLKFYKVSMEKAQCVFFQNAKNRDFMKKRGVAVSNSALLPGSGVNLKEHPYEKYPSEKDGINFLAVMRIMKDKGIEEYLEAAIILKNRDRHLNFWLVGEYEPETRGLYEPIIKQLEECGALKYFGHIDNVSEVMAQSHVIVHPSYHEGLSNVLLEAAACGRPVLASNISGCIEAFCDGKSGHAFEKENIDDLIAAIERIAAMPSGHRKHMGEVGRKWVEKHFDRKIVIQAYRDELAKIKKEN